LWLRVSLTFVYLIVTWIYVISAPIGIILTALVTALVIGIGVAVTASTAVHIGTVDANGIPPNDIPARPT
jgi:hypothetical protein